MEYFPLTETDASVERNANVLLENVLDQNSELNDQISKLNSENRKIKDQNTNLSNAQKTGQAKICELENEIKKLLFEEKFLTKPSKAQHKKIEELFIKSRNAEHNIPNYKILVNIQTKRFLWKFWSIFLENS